MMGYGDVCDELIDRSASLSYLDQKQPDIEV